MEHPKNEGLLVLDYGSQYTLLITRRLRELGIYTEVIDGCTPNQPENFKFHGLILSGGPDSVLEHESRKLPSWVLESGAPVLGICYGLQLLVSAFGGKLRTNNSREYGNAEFILSAEMKSDSARVFYGLPSKSRVWMSHGDDVESIPEEFETVGRTVDGVLAAIAHKSRPLLGLQFHPEVHHSDCGPQLLEQFAIEICHAPRNWQIDSIIDSLSNSISNAVGDGRVLIACSGGVDSSVASVLLSKALGHDRVTAVFVDNGLLRKNEVELVSTSLRGLGLNLEVLHKAEAFLGELKGKFDPEEKRKTIGRIFIETFEEFARSHSNFTHLGQGTLYPDVIESASHGSGAKVIKSHHNVGGLPDKLELQLIEPFRYLFKDEVRKIGEELGLPSEMIHRHPFPGPGLGIRIPGEVTAEKVAILQEADHIFIQGLHDSGLYDKVWQAATILLPVKSVGVMGDNRTYQWTCCLRAVAATDAMTANVSELPLDFLTRISDSIVRKVNGINRVLYDVTSKPPATIEWE
ncbi:MAG: glutamine-hydrolyzing GMP synthase [Bdellovibrionota bacterium]